jgi:hypothetical protein
MLCAALLFVAVLTRISAKFIIIEHVSKLRSFYGTEACHVSSSGNTSDESLGCARFESGLGHRLS